MTGKAFKLFLSSPGDVTDERRLVGLVVRKLNTEFAGQASIETVRWESSFYSAHDTFQAQIPEAATCDVVIAVFRARLGTQLPSSFPRLPSGEPYPSGTAYEVLSAIDARRRGRKLPDIFVFRYPAAPSVALDATDRVEIEDQWQRLRTFFNTWFRNKDGEFIAASQKYVSLNDFARKAEDCLRQWLAGHGIATQGPVWNRGSLGSPYPGLAAFEPDRSGVFFGRELAIAQAVERLREAATAQGRLPFLLIIGASGSGKSSLLRAGLIPRLTEPGAVPAVDVWRTAVITPGPQPFLALAEGLLAEAALGAELQRGAFATKELLARQLAGDPLTATAVIGSALAAATEGQRIDGRAAARLILAIDQAERLLWEAEETDAAAFTRLLDALVREGLAYVVFALRSDAYPRFQSIEALVVLRQQGATLDLVPCTAAELEEIVVRPAAACRPRLSFEHDGERSLATRLVADAKGGDALPLLQITLARLCAIEAQRGDGVLRHGDYRGMDAAVTETAELAFVDLPPEARAAVPALVTAFVRDVAPDTISGRPIPVIAAVDRAAFERNDPGRKALVRAFVEARLLTADGQGDTVLLRPIHEALLRIWPAAVAILDENAALIRVRRTLEPIVREWQAAADAEKGRHLDVSPALLDGAQRLDVRLADDLPSDMRAFVAQASRADAQRRGREGKRQRRLFAAAVTALGVVTALAGAALWQWRQAELERQRSAATLQKATSAADAMVLKLASAFRHRNGMSITLVRDILDRAVSLQRQIVATDGASPELLLSQARALNEVVLTELDQGSRQASSDMSSALAIAGQFRTIMEKLVSLDPTKVEWQRFLSLGLHREGDVLMVGGRFGKALDNFARSLRIRKALVSSDGTSETRADLAAAYEKVGDAEFKLGRYENARRSYDASLIIRNELVGTNRSMSDWRRDLAVSHERLGYVLLKLESPDLARQAFEASRDIRLELTAGDGSNLLWRSDLSNSYDGIGLVLRQDDDQIGEALQNFQKCLDLRQSLASADPDNLRLQRDLAAALGHVGEALRALDDREGAVNSFRREFLIRKTLVDADPDNTIWQADLAITLGRLASVSKNRNEYLILALQIAYRLADSGQLPDDQKDLPEKLTKLAAPR